MIGLGMLGGLRATLRLARRDAWRNKGRSALIALMVALPVLALAIVAVFFRSGQFEPRDVVTLRLGDRVQATISIGQPQTPIVQDAAGDNWASVNEITAVTGGSTEPTTAIDAPARTIAQFREQLRAVLPAGDDVLLDRQSYATRTLLLGDRALSAQLREFDYTAAGVGTMVEQLSGRAPAAPGEVVVTRGMARSDSIAIGDRIENQQDGAPVQQLTVVGIVGGQALAGQVQVIGPAGSLIQPGDELTGDSAWVVTGPAAVDWNRVRAANQYGLVVVSRDVMLNPSAQVTADARRLQELYASSGGPALDYLGVITVAIGLVLLQIALLAGPAIAVGARRNERTLALTAANGAAPQQLRSIVLATSGVIGLVGCTVAAAAGAGLGALGVVVVRNRFDEQLPRVDIHLTDLLLLVGVGALTAVGAAFIPARLAARLNVIATLTGRRGQVAPRRRVPLAGLVIALIGCGVCFFGATRQHPFLTVLGIAIAEIGLVTLTGSIVALIARTGRFLPFAPRFAVRDAGRQRGRTAPAIAAVMAAIAGSVAAGVFLASQDAQNRNDYRPVAASGVVTASWAADSDSARELARRGGQTAEAAITAALRRTLPIRAVAPVQDIAVAADQSMDLSLIVPAGQICPGVDTRFSLNGGGCQPFGPRILSTNLGSGTFFGDGTTLDTLTGQTHPDARKALAQGRAVVTLPQFLWPDGTVHAQLATYAETGDPKLREVVLPATLVPSEWNLPGAILPTSVAAKLGVRLTTLGLVASTTRTPSAQETERAYAAVAALADASVNVERGYVPDVAVALIALVAASALITLAGTFTAVGLAAAEGRADVSTLAAIGAGPGVRRRIAAAQAGVITFVGAGLGLVTGLLSGWALVRLMGANASGSWVISSGFGARSGASGWPFTVPWPAVLASAAGTPLLAIAIAFLVTRSRLPMVRRLGQ
jgi:putative ABC transport system permease protein